MYRFFVVVLACLLAGTALAQSNQLPELEQSRQFGDYTLHYSVFNSTFVPADIAGLYGLTRARDRALINISLTRTDAGGNTSLGLPAEVSGTAANLLQQQRPLDFTEIDEGNAVYYIASLKHTHEESINFSVRVQAEGLSQPLEISFSRKLYVEDKP